MILAIELPEICDWIESKGGYLGITIDDVFTIADAWLFNTPPPGEPPWTFIPTIQNVFGVADYWMGFNGDIGTGCSFYLPGVGRVENLTFPVEEVIPNVPFDVEYDCRNIGTTDTMWGHMLDTGKEIVGSRWEEEIIADGIKHVIIHFDGITASLNGRVEVGHVPFGLNMSKMYVVDHVVNIVGGKYEYKSP